MNLSKWKWLLKAADFGASWLASAGFCLSVRFGNCSRFKHRRKPGNPRIALLIPDILWWAEICSFCVFQASLCFLYANRNFTGCDSEDCGLMIPELEPFPPCSLSYFLPLPLSAVVDATRGSISTKRDFPPVVLTLVLDQGKHSHFGFQFLNWTDATNCWLTFVSNHCHWEYLDFCNAFNTGFPANAKRLRLYCCLEACHQLFPLVSMLNCVRR